VSRVAKSQGDPSGRDRLERLGLSPREVTVALLAARGGTNEEIARELDLSPLTVKKHLERLYAKAGVPNRTALAAWIWEHAPPKSSR
jgi:DNA-binding CsgD family transcriptional regulator